MCACVHGLCVYVSMSVHCTCVHISVCVHVCSSVYCTHVYVSVLYTCTHQCIVHMCMSMCMYMCAYQCMYIHVHISVCMYIHVHVSVCVDTCTSVYAHACTSACRPPLHMLLLSLLIASSEINLTVRGAVPSADL